MPKLKFSQHALKDLENITDYISGYSPQNARSFVNSLAQKCEKLSSSPKIGKQHNDLRKFPVGNYIIFYSETKKGVDISRVLHGGRDVEKIISQKTEQAREKKKQRGQDEGLEI